MKLSVDAGESIEACAWSGNDSAGRLALNQVDPKFSYILWIHEVYSCEDIKLWSFCDMFSGDEDDGHPGASSTQFKHICVASFAVSAGLVEEGVNVVCLSMDICWIASINF